VTENRAYLLNTWHPSTRPQALTFDPAIEWIRLEILGRTAGGMLDSEGTVDFRATYRTDGVRQEQSENSRFVKQAKNWLYVDDA
jgi:SEC-C motif-containing protein